MHILVTNDDGPPSSTSSPYILPFVNALEKAGHTVSVIIPDSQRSWIGKAHMVGQDVQTSFYWPPTTAPEEHSSSTSVGDDGRYPWVLCNSTPAGCSQLGISHFFKDRGPIDLVISGPNYGRNTTAVFALSSGTLGAALEASVCGHRAIALSFAFFVSWKDKWIPHPSYSANEIPLQDRKNDPDVVAESCQQGVRVCEYLAKSASWEASQLYSVNVPVKEGVLKSRVSWTSMLQNQWQHGACFQELPQGSGVDDPASEEAELRRQESQQDGGGEGSQGAAQKKDWRHRHFKWAPRFTDVYESVQKHGPGSDGWAVKEGETSITALRANFMHAEGFEGEVKL